MQDYPSIDNLNPLTFRSLHPPNIHYGSLLGAETQSPVSASTLRQEYRTRVAWQITFTPTSHPHVRPPATLRQARFAI